MKLLAGEEEQCYAYKVASLLDTFDFLHGENPSQALLGAPNIFDIHARLAVDLVDYRNGILLGKVLGVGTTYPCATAGNDDDAALEAV